MQTLLTLTLFAASAVADVPPVYDPRSGPADSAVGLVIDWYEATLEGSDAAPPLPISPEFELVTLLGETANADGMAAAIEHERMLAGEGGSVEVDARSWTTHTGDLVGVGKLESTERYRFAAGGGYELRVTWTIGVGRDAVGDEWQLLRIHRSIDPVDNAVNLSSGKRIALLFGTIGAGVGAFFGWAVARYRSRTARVRRRSVDG